MKISVDTNVLARAVLQDDPAQGRMASKVLQEASLIAVSLSCLCELVWVLRQGAKLSKDDVALTIRDLLDAANVVMNRPAVEAGLGMLAAGGDFADGGSWLMRAPGSAAKPSCPSTSRQWPFCLRRERQRGFQREFLRAQKARHPNRDVAPARRQEPLRFSLVTVDLDEP